MNSPSTLPKLGIIAGRGDLPQRLITACTAEGREFFVIAVEENTDPELVENLPHAWARFGAVGQVLEHFRNENVSDIVLAGRMRRPSLIGLRPDAGGMKLLAKLGSAFLSGDDALLTGIIKFFEEEGFKVVGADSILTDLLTPAGPIGKLLPDAASQNDITIGVKAAHALGALDIGQAVIVQQGIVLGVEAAEGTDDLITRCGHLRFDGPGGVLVKAKKPGQERRADLPAIGVSTVEHVHHAGFTGIAIEAGGSLIIDRAQVVATADRLGIFIVGFSVS